MFKLINKNIITTTNAKFSKENLVSYIQKNDFNLLMALFSRMLLANEWRDYSFKAKKNEIIFCFYKHSHDAPIYKVTYSRKNRKYSEWIIFYNNKKVRTSLYLKQIIQWLEGQHLKIIKQ